MVAWLEDQKVTSLFPERETWQMSNKVPVPNKAQLEAIIFQIESFALK